MIASAWFLLSLCVHAGSTDSLSQAKFTLERQAFSLEPSKQAITIDPEGPDLVFRLITAAQLDADTRIEASLIGPSLAAPLTINQPALAKKVTLPRDLFSAVGVYQLTQIRLTRNGLAIEAADPATVEIQVAEKFIVTDVQVRELSQAELAEKGYVFNENDYFSVNFSLKFQVHSQTEVVAVNIPAVFPRYENTNFTPRIIEDPFHPYVLAIPTFYKVGYKTRSDLGAPGNGEGESSKRIPGLILIPGNFKYLKSHFEIAVVTLNAAPTGFDVRVQELKAQLVLPGPVASGELPLSINEPTRKLMVNLGEDGEPGTADDRATILPGERANTDYVVTGNLPGTHDIEILISGDIDLPQGREKVYSEAKSTIYVRSPEFSITFEHPDVVVEEEPFDLVVHVHNKGETDLEDFTMTLDPDRMVGVRLDGSHPVQSAGTIPRGGEGLVTYRLRSLLTGSVKSGFFKAANSAENSIQMRVGVGQIGERLSPYVLEFPEVFRSRFPAPLVTQLERFAKRALDVALTADHELPGDLSPVSPAAVREFNRAMALVAASDDYGNPLPQRLLQLFSQWARSLKDYAPLDMVRRKIINQQLLTLEQAFGTALGDAFASTNSASLLTQLAQENERTPGLFAYIVEADGPLELRLRDGEERSSSLDGSRDIPFSSIVPLAPNKVLVWLSNQAAVPRLELKPTDMASRQVAIHALFPGSTNQWLVSTQQTLTTTTTLNLDPTTSALTVQIVGKPDQRILGYAVPIRPLELLTIKQADPASFGSADVLGRSHILYFSKTIDLASIVPLSDHITIGGLPVVEGILQKDGRTLIVASKMPLGPYHPIPYSITGLKSVDGQELPDTAGTYNGNPFFVGVSVSGRVVERNGRDLSEAKVFLWILERQQDPELRRRAANGEDVAESPFIVWRILSQKRLDANQSYLFEYAPFVPFSTDTDLANRFHQFKIGILMPDGLYEERTITPLGAGQEIVVDFSFLAQGAVQGYVRHSDGSPIPFAKVVAISHHNNQSGGLTQTDINGFYRVENIEVGQVLVKSAEMGVIGYGSGYLTTETNPLQIDVVIDRPTAHLFGTVTANVQGEALPLAGAIVGYAAQGTLTHRITLTDGLAAPFSSYAMTDEHGNFAMDDAPAGDGTFWVFHPFYNYESRPLILQAGESVRADHSFNQAINPNGVITGTVRDEQGQAITAAALYLEWDNQRTFSDAAGRFTLTGVPVGRTLSLRAEHPGFRTTRLEVRLSSERLDQLAIVMPGPIRVTGEYLTAHGDPVPFAMVYLQGRFLGGDFGDAELVAQTRYDGSWTAELESPGTLRFSGYRPPALASTQVSVQGGEHVSLNELPTRDLRVRLIDSHDQPVVAKVYLSSMGPANHRSTLGQPVMLERTPVFTDNDGYALFRNLNIGSFEVYGKLNNLGQTPTLSSVLQSTPDGSALEVTLRFPPKEEEANLFGTVFEADGSPAPAGTLVKVRVGNQTGFRIVDALGSFRFDELVTTSEPTRVSVLAYNPNSGHYENAFIDLHQDLNFRLDMTLRRKGNLKVRVIQGDGEPADFAAVAVDFANIDYTPPREGSNEELDLGTIRKEGQITPENPVFEVRDIPVGPFIIKASSGNGFRGLRAYSMPLEGGDLEVVVRLESSSQISGIFLDHSEIPIADAEIRLYGDEGLLGQRLSANQPGEEGHFLFPDLPMRTYTLQGTDPNTNFKASLEVITSPFTPAPFVELRLNPIAHLEGYVYNGGQAVTGALVTLVSGALNVKTGTDAQGRYRFANLPLRTYKVTATSPFVPGSVTKTVQLSEANATVLRDLHYTPTVDLDLLVEASDGTPAEKVLVSVYNAAYAQTVANSAFTDANGHALIGDLPPGSYTMIAEHPGELATLIQTLVLSKSETSPAQRQVRFPGWGSITGTIRDSLGNSLDQSITVHLDLSGSATAVSTDAAGRFSIGKIPLDRPIVLTALNPSTRDVATATVELDHHGQEIEVELTFRGSTTVSGTVLQASGQPAAFITVQLLGDYTLHSQTDAYGHYRFESVLEGSHTIIAKDPQSPRRAARDIVVLAGNGQLPQPLEDIDLVLTGIGQVLGQVTYGDGAIVPFGSVKLTNTKLKATLTTIIQGDGSFLIPQVPLGTWLLSAYDDTYSLASPTTSVILAQDGQTLESNIIYPPSFTLEGLLIGPDRVTPVAGGRVKLWRPRNGSLSQYDLIYSTITDDHGAYHLDRVYPGSYLIDGDDPDLLMNYKAPILMPNQNTRVDVFLENETWVQGTLRDANGRLYRSGTVSLSQFGRTYTAKLQANGSFTIRSLSAGPCVLAWNVSGGWTQGSRNEILGSGINRPAIITEPTLTLSGRAILAKLPPAHPSVSISVHGIAKTLPLNASGDWLVDEVPASALVKLKLSHGSANRFYSLGSFTSAQDLGTFWLDGTGPDLRFADAGTTVAESPYRLNFQVGESDPESLLVPARTRVWLNGRDISSAFTTTQTDIFADFAFFDDRFLLGPNRLVVEAANNSNLMTRKTFSFNLELQGTTLEVSLRNNGTPITGEFKLGEREYQASDANGRVIIADVAPGTYELAARATDMGMRGQLTVTRAVQQNLDLDLEFVGEYRGRVLGLDGNPLAGVTVALGDVLTHSDEEGNYRAELLPLGDYTASASHQGLFAYRVLPDLNRPGQVVLAADIQFEGTGLVQGRVLDDDGARTIPRASLELAFTSLPAQYHRQVTCDDQGNFRIEGVPMRAFTLSAYDPQSRRGGLAQGLVPQAGATLDLDVKLSPSGDITALVHDRNGDPVANLFVTARGNGLVFTATTDANGRFTLTGLPYRTYSLTAERIESSEYLNASHEVDRQSADLGTLTMVTDKAPSILATTIPNPLDPLLNPALVLNFSDDRQLDRYILVTSGAYNYTLEGSLSGRTNNVYPRLGTSGTTPDGHVDYTLTVFDTKGHSKSATGGFEILRDQIGPVLAITKPTVGAAVSESSTFSFEATASDPAGVQSVSFFMNGQAVGTSTGASFKTTVRAPAVAADTQVLLRAEARDRRGNTSVQERNLTVRAIQTSGAPTLALLSPVEGLRLPLDLAQGLELRVQALIADPDGIAEVRIFCEGQELYQSAASGTQLAFDQAIVLPASLRGAAALQLELHASDTGANTAIATARIQAFTEPYQTFTSDRPLRLAAYDLAQDNQSLVLAGGHHLIDGNHRFLNLILVNGATLSQTTTSTDQAYVANTQLAVSSTCVIDGHCSIDVDGKGYANLPQELGLGTGAPSHGGLGRGTTNLRQIYGSPFKPTLPGARRGGGAVKLTAGEIWLLGEISANAGSDGAGGSIWLDAPRFEGLGKVTANGYRDTYSATTYGGGGGRIAIYGHFDGTVEAYGGKGCGAGTIFTRVPDAAQADGYFDRILVKAHPDASADEINLTALPELEDLVVGTDLVFSTQYRANQAFQVADFFETLRFGAFVGMRFFDQNSPSTSAVASQDATRLWSDPEASFGTYANGQHLALTYAVDELAITQGARFNLEGVAPRSPITLDNATLLGGAGSVQLQAATTNLRAGARLDGTFAIGELPLPATGSVAITGNLTVDRLLLTGRTLLLDGTLTATERIEVASDAKIQPPFDLTRARMVLRAPTMTIAGQMIAQRNGESLSSTYQLAHGGLGGGPFTGKKTYDSLYHPVHGGSSSAAGGYIELAFDHCTLNGRLDVSSSTDGSAGAILLAGQTLLGTGTLAANGQSLSNYKGAGGRVAVLVDQIDGFSGPVSAMGGSAPQPDLAGGAGTVFWRTAQWPNGKLVVDNGGVASKAGSTLLPGLGNRTAATATGGATLAGSGFPDHHGLVGLYLEVPDRPLVRIASHTTTALVGETPFPSLAPGDSYSGRHRLDILEVRGQANLKSIDPIEVLQSVVIENGSIDIPDFSLPDTTVFHDGSLELFNDPGIRNLELDNFELTTHFPLQLEQLALRNGAVLRYDEAVTVTGAMTLDNSRLYAKVEGSAIGLTAASLSLTNNSGWYVSDRKSNGEAYPIHARIAGALTLDATSVISTSGAAKVDTRATVWAGSTWPSRSHGGFSELGDSPNERPVMDSFANPKHYGGINGGGVIHLTAASMVLDGRISANGYDDGAGGAIRLDADLLAGVGRIEAKSGTGNGGGGRVAVYYGQDPAFLDSLSFDLGELTTNQLYAHAIGGAGTLFAKGSNQTHGDLIVDQSASRYTHQELFRGRHRLTGVAGVAPLTMNLPDTDARPEVVSDPSWPLLPPGLEGLQLELTVEGNAIQALILDNTHNSITVDRPLPATLPAGTTLQLVLALDRLILRDGAQLHFPGIIDAATTVQSGPVFTSLWAHTIRNLPNPLLVEGHDQRLILNHPNLGDQDIEVRNATLYLDRPLQLRDLTLEQATVAVSYSSEDNPPSVLQGSIDLNLRHLTMDAASVMDASVSHKRPGDWNHGGIGLITDTATHGNLFRPTSFGHGSSAGGKIHINAERINGGRFLANGQSSSGGSIWLETAILAGTIDAQAYPRGSTGGGGRIAIYASDDSAATVSTRASGSVSAGTVYRAQAPGQPGTLILDNYGATSSSSWNNITPIPVFATTSLTGAATAVFQPATSSTLLTVPALALDMDYVGYHLVVVGDHARNWPILASSRSGANAVFTLAGDASNLTSGDLIAPALKLSTFQRCAICAIHPTNLILLEDEPPVIGELQITGLVHGQIASGRPFQVQFSATDNFAVTGASLRFGASSQTLNGPGPFQATLTAPSTPGDYTLTVEVFDANANTAMVERLLPVIDSSADTEGPAIELLTPEPNAAVLLLSNLDFQFKATDPSELQQLRLTFGSFPPVNITTPQSGRLELASFSLPFVALDTVMNYLIEATDGLGQTSSLAGQVTVRRPADAVVLPNPTTYLTFDNRDLAAGIPRDLLGRTAITYNKGTNGIAGKVGQALDFSGTSPSCLLSQSVGSLTPTSRFSYAVWVKLDTIVDFAGIVTLGDWLGPNQFRLSLRNGNLIEYAMGSTSIATAAVSTNRWYHCVATYDGTSASLYVDGQKIATQAVTMPTTATRPVLTLGVEHPGGSLQYLNGQVDEFTLWSQVLSDQQVNFLYELGQRGAVLDIRPAADVTNFTATSTTSTLTLSWTGSVDDDGDLAGYRLYLDGAANPIVLPPTTSSHRLENLAPATIYQLRLTTVDRGGTESPGAETVAVTLGDDGLPLMPSEPLTSFSLDAPSISGTTVQGRQGGVNGTLSGAVLNSAGQVADGLFFDGVNDYVSLTATTAMNNLQLGNYTLSAWFRPDSMPNNVHLGFDSTEHSDNNYSYSIIQKQGEHSGLRFNSYLAFDHWFSDKTRVVPKSPVLLPGRFYHAVGVVDRDLGTARLYLDGKEVSVVAFTPGKAGRSLAANPWKLGTAVVAGSTYRWPMKGLIDEAAFWDRALTPTEIASLFQVAKNKLEPDSYAPEPITNLQVAAGAQHLNLSWTASANSRGDLAGYRIRLNQGPSLFVPAPNTTYTLTGLTPSTRYNLEVRAVDLHGLVSAAVNAQVDTTPLDTQPPQLLNLQVSGMIAGELPLNQAFTVSFSASDNLAVTLARLQFDGQILERTGAGPFSFTLTTPNSAGDYPLLAEVFDANGNRASQNTTLLVRDLDIHPPSIEILAPAAHAAVDHLSQVSFSFRAVDPSGLQSLSLSFGGDAPLNVATPISGQLETLLVTMPRVDQDTVITYAIQARDIHGNNASLSGDLTVQPVNQGSLPAPYAYWPFDGSDLRGEIPFDVRGKAEVRYSFASIGVNGKVNEAVGYEGYLPSITVVEQLPVFTPGARFTFATWANMASFNDQAGLISYGDWLGTAVFSLVQRTTTGAGNVLALQVDGQSLETPALANNRWYHLAVTYNAGTTTLYLDGQAVGSRLLDLPTASAPTLCFGVEHTGFDLEHFTGRLDELALWQTNLSPAQIDALYQQGNLGIAMDFRPLPEVDRLTAIASSQTIELTWEPYLPLNLAEFRLYRDRQSTYQTLPPTATSASVTDLAPASAHHFRLTTVDQHGNESPGALTSAVTRDSGDHHLMPPGALASFSLDAASVMALTHVEGRQPGISGSLQGTETEYQGRVAEALRFNGYDDALILVNPSSMDQLHRGNYSLSLWFRPFSMPQTIYLGPTSEDNNARFGLLHKGPHQGLSFDGSLNLSHGFADQTALTLKSPRLLPFTTYHAVAVVDRDQGKASLFLDGQLVASASFDPGKEADLLAALPWTLGTANPNGETQRWPLYGWIDEVALWDQALNAEQVAGLFQVANRGEEPDTLAPEPVTDLLLAPASDRLDLSWTASLDSRGDLAGYKLRIDQGPWIYLGANATTYTVPGLVPSTLYRVQIHAIDSQGVLSTVTTAQATTLGPPKRLVSQTATPLPSTLSPWLTPAGDLELRGGTFTVHNLAFPGRIYLVGAKLVVRGTLQARSLHLSGDAVLTSTTPKGEPFQPLVLRLVETLEIGPGARIDLDGRGLHGTPDQLSHGGLADGARVEELSDAPLYPLLPGGGQAGGGVLYLEASQLLLQGSISARGLGPSAGGAVQLHLSELAGPGHIDVSGGQDHERRAGGGRVAIHAPRRQRFLGTIATGAAPTNQGSIVFSDGPRSFPFVCQTWPLSEHHEPIALLPDRALESAEIDHFLANQFGSLVVLHTDRDPSPYAGFWLEHQAERYRVLSIQSISRGRFILQLDRHLAVDDLNGARFVLPTLNHPPLVAPTEAVQLPKASP